MMSTALDPISIRQPSNSIHRDAFFRDSVCIHKLSSVTSPPLSTSLAEFHFVDVYALRHLGYRISGRQTVAFSVAETFCRGLHNEPSRCVKAAAYAAPDYAKRSTIVRARPGSRR